MQFLIEEAVFERLEFEELQKRADTPIVTSDPMAEARAFAEGRV